MSIRGRLTGELHLLWEQMKAFGQSKRDDKEKARAEGKKFWHYMNKKIYSISTYKTYKGKARQFVHWCKDRYGIEWIREISVPMFKAYAAECLVLRLKPNSVKTYCCAIAKLGEGIGKADAFHRASEKIQGTLPREKPSRPVYESLEQALKVLSEVERNNERYGLAMRLQLETACRLCEVERLRLEDLGGLVVEDGKTVGVLHLHGKNGRPRAITVSEHTYWEIEKALGQSPTLINREGYRCAVKRASEKLGLKSGGTHKARRFSIQRFVRDGWKELRAIGLSSHEASVSMLHEANRQLGHSPARKSTTRIYLRA